MDRRLHGRGHVLYLMQMTLCKYREKEGTIQEEDEKDKQEKKEETITVLAMATPGWHSWVASFMLGR